MAKPLTALLIEDSEDDALLIARVLKRADYELTFKRVDTAEAMKAALKEQQWDVVLSDYVMPNFSAPAALEILKQSGQDLPFIVVSGAIGEDTAVAVMRAGAHDYMMKDNLVRLPPAIEREMHEAANRRNHRRAEEISMRLGRILDNSSNEIYVFDAASFRFVQVNHGACQNLGYSQEELLERMPLDLQPEMDTHKFAELLRPLYSNDRDQVVYETVQCRRNGSIYPIEVQLTLSHSENPPVFVAIAQDITERKRAESVLVFMAEASKVLAATLDYDTTFQSVAHLAVSYLADLCVVDLIDEDGNVRRVAASYKNQADSKISSYLAEGFTTRLHKPHPILDVLEAGKTFVTSKVVGNEFASMIQNEAYRSLLVSLPVNSLMSVPLILRERTLGVITLVSTQENRFYGPSDIAIAEELARRAAAAVENARLYREAQQALQLRDQFLSIAAHELKTPLTALLGNTQLIQRRVSRTHTFTEREEHVLKVVDQQAKRLARMIEALLDISRIRGGTLSIERDLLDLGALAQRLIDEMQPALERHSIETHISEQPVVIAGDGLRLEQVFQNIIHNAIKYSPDGGKIRLDILQIDDEACVAITDQGIGIPAKALPNLFRQFYRADNAQSHQIAGMGLGLYVVREIVSLHGGRVEVESTEGRGSTFRVYLPLTKDHLGTGNQTDTTPKQTGTNRAVDPTINSSRAFTSIRRTA